MTKAKTYVQWVTATKYTSDAPKLTPGWRDNAACLGTDPETWFPVSAVDSARAMAIARKICDTCPVKPECLMWATQMREHGIWAATTQDERENARRRATRKQGVAS